MALPRLTLLLNHIVSSEPEALARLRPHAGQSIDILWHTAPATGVPMPSWLSQKLLPAAGALPPAVRLTITPAGMFESMLLDGADIGSAQGLTLAVALPDPIALAKLTLTGQRPDVSIEGNAALAEAAAWLMKHLRWDVQDDLARWFGHMPAELLRTISQGIKQGLQRWKPGSGTSL